MTTHAQPSMFPNDPTLTEIRAQLIEERTQPDGTSCPACSQHVQQYRRKLNTGMARSLIAMWRKAGPRWIHLPTALPARSREEGKLRWWGLVEESEIERDDGGRAGWWRLTADGQAFVQRKLWVPSHAVVYANQLQRLEGSNIDIVQALGSQFDYRQLMEGR